MQYSFNTMLPVLIIFVAFVTGIVLLIIPEQREKLRTTINLLSATVNIGLIGKLVAGVYAGIEYKIRFPLLPDVDLVLHADKLSLMFVALSGVLWFVTTIYAVGYLRGAKHRSRFFGFFSLCVFSTLGVALAGNLVTFLIFYELLTLATYPLLVHKGNAASLRAGRIYLRYTLFGGSILLIGVVWLKSIAGSLDFASTGTLASLANVSSTELIIIFCLLIAGLGVKAALVPLHGWLPEAMAAPAPVSALLHAVAVVKAGAFGIVRVVYDVYGIELSSALGLTTGLAIAASITIIYGSLMAIRQDDLKKRLAFSTVSQVSYIALGTAIAGPLAAIGAIVHLVHQGLMKITMFFCAGNLAETLGIHKVSEMDGVGKRMPITMGAFTLAILGMIGIPPMAGFVSKWYLGVGAIQSGMLWVIVVLALSSLLNAIYFLPILYRAWFKPSTIPWSSSSERFGMEIYWMLLLPPVISISLAAAAGIFASSQLSPLSWAKLISANEYGLDMSNIKDLATQVNPLFYVVCSPFILATLLFLKKTSQWLIYLTPLAALPAIYISMFSADMTQSIDFLFFGSVLVLDDLSRNFLLLAGLLFFLSNCYAIFYQGIPAPRTPYFITILITMGACFGLVVSQDMYGFICYFTIMSLSSYVLIIKSQTEEARSAANSYIKWVIAGEIALFSVFCWIFYQNIDGVSSLSETPYWLSILLVVSFGIKTGLFGFHFWLPKAHPVAAVPASALLSGFMVKAGIIGWLRFFPELSGESYYAGMLLIILGFSGTFVAAILALVQKDPKAVLAYSTVSQMGILAGAFGVTLIAPENTQPIVAAIILYCIHHGLVKSALFLSVGIFPLFKQYNYIAYGIILLPALSLIGVPLLSGSFAKNILKDGLIDFPMIKTLIATSSVVTAMVMLRFIHLAKEKTKLTTSNSDTHSLAPLAIICIVNIVIMLAYPFYFLDSAELVQHGLISNLISLWPLGLAFFLYVLMLKPIRYFADLKPVPIYQKPAWHFTKSLSAGALSISARKEPLVAYLKKHIYVQNDMEPAWSQPKVSLMLCLVYLALFAAFFALS